jgi:hypothetical protein
MTGGRPRSLAHALAWLLAALAVSILTLPGPLRAGEELRIKEARTRLADRTYILDALIDYKLSGQALEALDNGVPLTFVVRIQVRPVDAWIWEDSAADIHLRYRLRYKPLSERYEVFRLPGDSGRVFVSREAAIAALGEIRNLSLVSQDRLEPDTQYEVQIKVALDIEELPLPLRPMAYLRPAWKLVSSWSKWPLMP